MKYISTLTSFILIVTAFWALCGLAVGPDAPSDLETTLTGLLVVAAAYTSALTVTMWTVKKPVPQIVMPETTARYVPVIVAINSLRGKLETSGKPVEEQKYILSWMSRQQNLSLRQLEKLTGSLLDHLLTERYRAGLPDAVQQWYNALPSTDKVLGKEIGNLYLSAHMNRFDGEDDLLLLDHMTLEVKKELKRISTSSADQRWI